MMNRAIRRAGILIGFVSVACDPVWPGHELPEVYFVGEKLRVKINRTCFADGASDLDITALERLKMQMDGEPMTSVAEVKKEYLKPEFPGGVKLLIVNEYESRSRIMRTEGNLQCVYFDPERGKRATSTWPYTAFFVPWRLIVT